MNSFKHFKKSILQILSLVTSHVWKASTSNIHYTNVLKNVWTFYFTEVSLFNGERSVCYSNIQYKLNREILFNQKENIVSDKAMFPPSAKFFICIHFCKLFWGVKVETSILTEFKSLLTKLLVLSKSNVC